jgi:hypothetical protein
MSFLKSKHNNNKKTIESEMEKREISMKVGQVLHMNGGTGHTSYAHNSLLQV